MFGLAGLDKWTPKQGSRISIKHPGIIQVGSKLAGFDSQKHNPQKNMFVINSKAFGSKGF